MSVASSSAGRASTGGSGHPRDEVHQAPATARSGPTDAASPTSRTTTVLTAMLSATAAISATYVSLAIAPAATAADPSTNENSPTWPSPMASWTGRDGSPTAPG